MPPTEVGSAKVPSTKTPQRPSLISDESVSSVKSTFSELSLFDSNSAGDQTPITPFDSPEPQYFQDAKKDERNDVRRLLWKKKVVVENVRNDHSSGRSTLVVPSALYRPHAKSAPEKGQTIDMNTIHEKIDDLVHQLEAVDLKKDAVDSQSFEKSTRRSTRRGRNIETTGEDVEITQEWNTSTDTKMEKLGDVTKVSSTTRKFHDLEVVKPQDDGNLRDGSPVPSKEKPRITGNIDHDTSLNGDRSSFSAAEPQDRIKSSSDTILAGNMTTDSERHFRKKSEESSNPPSEALESLVASQSKAIEDLESVPLENSARLADRATSATTGTTKSRKPRTKPSPRSKQNPVVTPRILGRFGPPKSKRDIKLGILKYLRQQNLDPKPNPQPDSKARSGPNPKLGARVKQPKKERKYNNLNGYVYIFTSPSFPNCCKIGSTRQEPEDRCKEWATNCKLVCTHISDPNTKGFTHYGRVERLVHLELCNERRKYTCWDCGTKHAFRLWAGKQKKGCGETNDENEFPVTEHGEWFEVSEERALAVVEKWRKWVVDNEPYRKDGSLRDKWIWKAKQAENSVEMEWSSWLRKKLPKILRATEPVEREWDWDRWGQMRWDDWLFYIFYHGIAGLRMIWPQLEDLLWYPGLIVWILVWIAPIVAYFACGGGKIGLRAALGAIVAIVALWLLGVILKS